MLRFVGGLQKAIRSTQSRAPCGKVSQDTEELFDNHAEINQTQTQRSITSVPLSLDLHAEEVPASKPQKQTCRLITSVLLSVDPFKHDCIRGSKKADNHRSSGSNPNKCSWFPSHGVVEGAVLGAGYSIFNSIHAYCTGFGKQDRSKYCPITAAGKLSEDIRHTFFTSHLAQNVLPQSKKSKKIQIVEKKAVTENADNQKQVQQVRKRLEDSVRCLTHVKNSNTAAIDHLVALHAWENKEFRVAATVWQQSLEKISSPIAAYRLGVCYENGHAVQKDYHQAAKYYKISAKMGHAQSMYNLAQLQITGKIDDIKIKPLTLMKRACEHNLPQAQMFMGSYYFHKNNKKLAVQHFKLAADGGDADGCYHMGVCYETGAGLPESDDSQAYSYYQQAAELGHSEAQYNLAVFLEEGYGGVERDSALSLMWYRKSESQGNQHARDRLIQLGCMKNRSLSPSPSLPTFTSLILSFLPHHLDLTISHTDEHMMRSRSENVLVNLPGNNQMKISDRSTTSSVTSLDEDSAEGKPMFFIPETDSADDSSDWSNSTNHSSPVTTVNPVSYPVNCYNESSFDLFTNCSSRLHSENSESDSSIIFT